MFDKASILLKRMLILNYWYLSAAYLYLHTHSVHEVNLVGYLCEAFLFVF